MSDEMAPEEGEELCGDEDFRTSFGEDLAATLNLNTWDQGLDLENVMARFRKEIASAVDKENRLRAVIRAEILPRLKRRPNGPAEGGVYKANAEQLSIIHQGLLFSGHVDAVRATSASHESLPISITQLGIAVVGYNGRFGTFSQRLFRKEMSNQSADPVGEAMACIDRRNHRSPGGRLDTLSKLARRGIRTYAERAVLVERSQAEWRLGHGNPCAYELLSGSGYMSLLQASLGVLRRLIQQHKKFVFVSSVLEEQGLLTIGQALDPGEYAIFETLERHGERIVDGWRYGPQSRKLASAFVRECCPQVLAGVFRASERTPPRLFFAHREFVHDAALVALADSILRPERGFPMLLDVAETSCRSAFGQDGFLGLVQDAYAQAGANLQYFSERDTRR